MMIFAEAEAPGLSGTMILTIISAIFTGLLSLVAAIGAMIQSIRNGRQIAKVDTNVKESAAASSEKLLQIHVLTNSTHTQALTEIANLRSQISGMTQKPGDVKLADEAAKTAKAAAPSEVAPLEVAPLLYEPLKPAKPAP